MGCREQKLKGPCIIHAAKVKQIPECATESDKRRGNGKRVKVRKVMDSDGSGACTQGSGTQDSDGSGACKKMVNSVTTSSIKDYSRK